MTGYYLTLCRRRTRVRIRRPGNGSNLDAHHDRKSIVGAHAVEFSKTAGPPLRGVPADRPARACVERSTRERTSSIAPADPPRKATSAPPARPTTCAGPSRRPGPTLADDLHRNHPLARAVVEVHQDH